LPDFEIDAPLDAIPTTASTSDEQSGATTVLQPAPTPQARPGLDSGAEARDRRCATCGNAYDKAFEVVTAAGTFVFDCFECAAHALAPRCARCRCRVLGHGVESGGVVYCCANCAHESGVSGLADRA